MLSVGLLGKPSGVISGGEQEYQVRVVDDGSLDRELVRNLIKLTRPVNERVDRFLFACGAAGATPATVKDLAKEVLRPAA